MSPWETWRNPGPGYVARLDVPAVTWSRQERMTLNRGAWDVLGRPAKVMLLHDAENGRVGFRAATAREKGSLAVANARKQDRTHYVSAKIFRVQVGIPEDAMGKRYELRDGGDGVMAFSLAEGEPVRPNSRRA